MCKNNIFLLFFIALPSIIYPALPFTQVVIWGHKLHSHTHSYIHNAFFEAFKAMGYATYWFDNNDEVSHINFDHTLFITEGQVDKKIPINATSFYILHNCEPGKYRGLFDSKHAIILQVYTNRCRNQHADIQEAEPFIITSLSDHTIYMPWATDLLPDEITAQQIKLVREWPNQRENYVAWVGTQSGGTHGNEQQLAPFFAAAKKQRLRTVARTGASVLENKDLIYHALLAPTIVGKWQKDEGYIPCRIFKNISYGQLGITNSETIYRLFQGKIIYAANTETLFDLAYKKMHSVKAEEIVELMEFVKNHHTYIHRITSLLDFFDNVYNR